MYHYESLWLFVIGGFGSTSNHFIDIVLLEVRDGNERFRNFNSVVPIMLMLIKDFFLFTL